MRVFRDVVQVAAAAVACAALWHLSFSTVTVPLESLLCRAELRHIYHLFVHLARVIVLDLLVQEKILLWIQSSRRAWRLVVFFLGTLIGRELVLIRLLGRLCVEGRRVCFDMVDFVISVVGHSLDWTVLRNVSIGLLRTARVEYRLNHSWYWTAFH